MKIDSSLIFVVLFVLFTALAGLFGGAETGMYQLSRLRLRLGIEKKELGFVLLGKIMRDTGALLLSMLVGTNLAQYFATSTVTILLLTRMGSEHAAELAATLITVPLLFVFSELIPKHIFYYRADALMPYVAGVLLVFHRLFSIIGVAGVLAKLSRVFARLSGSRAAAPPSGSAVRHPHIEAIIRHTREEGILSPTQIDILNRLAAISNISVRAVMTALNKVWTVDINSGREVLLNILESCPYTRLLVRQGPGGEIIGFVNIYEPLCSPGAFSDLRGFLKPVRKISGDTTVSEAIGIMQSERRKIVLVMKSGLSGEQKPVGVITMKDLAEELLGELTEW